MEEPRSLIMEIERRDRRFRISQSIFNFMIALLLVGTLFGEYASMHAQIVALNALNDKRRAETQVQLDQVANYMRCLASIFAEHEPGSVTIDDLDTCRIHINQGGSSANPTAVTAEPAPTTASPSPAPAAAQATTPAPTPQPTPTPRPTPSGLICKVTGGIICV